ncbi:MAG: Preprotein translocase, SecE subunit [Candidatus Kaiserbacteria bacterium GW2011_GWA2_49_19]|uniref:Protein translocase subunit SecE n=2 Tax=Candidatus Kaiseribacteriota TaxID=1752734 RepID=A0A0G1YSL6_9BACT|nr:MAG: Preprotein translocase, SecE subunit [Candidatus Kaiserbacteria bacterium GW2011_GWA2_49_19]OGG60717.1 MAG: preprotein translocase subunit SecE [Candidatus Kaiserbacteria bacterium RIFCSPHIGHO2_02_FULL_49_16]
MGFIQYLKDTRGELNHVAWPTRLQTIVYTIIVILLSIFIAMYLGLFDYIFTTSLKNALQILPTTPPVSIENIQYSTTTPVSTTTNP